MNQHNIGKGLCLGIGGSNARVALCENGEISEFSIDPTPAQTADFFKWLADKIEYAADKGATWAVIGVPGIVEEANGQHSIGPLVNIPGLSDKSYGLERELAAASPKVNALLQNDFTVTAANDGLLSAFAAAKFFADTADRHYNSVAYFIMGTGVGGAIVRRQKKTGAFRPSESLMEIGHVSLNHDLEETFQTALSGTGLERKHGLKAERMDSDHQAWVEVGQYLGQMIMILGLIGGAELVVMGGGVGSNAYSHYFPYLEDYLEKFRTSTNSVHRLAVPSVIATQPKDAQTFEMYGAEGIIRHYLANK